MVAQDRLENGQPAPANHHPVGLTAHRVALALEEIRFQRGNSVASVLDERAVQRLAPPLAEALAEAKPTEDVVFAVQTRRAHWLLGDEMSSVAARIFVVGGQMHVIMGDMFRGTISEAMRDSAGTDTTVDRRLKPHRPGSRAHPRPPTRPLVRTATTTMYIGGRGERLDWLVIKCTPPLPGTS